MKSIFLIPVLFFTLFMSAAYAGAPMHGEEPTFQEFLAQFPKASLPYRFDAQQLQEALLSSTGRSNARLLDWEYYSFLPMLEEIARINHMPVHPEPIAAFETEQFYAVLYNTGRLYTKNVKSYHISVFDKAGNHLATHFVAGANAETITEATITENLIADIQTYQVNWAKTYQKGANDGNTVVGLTPAGRQTISLLSGNTLEQVQWAAYEFGAVMPAKNALTAEAK